MVSIRFGIRKRYFRELYRTSFLYLFWVYEHTIRENRYTTAPLYGVLLSNDGHALQGFETNSCIYKFCLGVRKELAYSLCVRYLLSRMGI